VLHLVGYGIRRLFLAIHYLGDTIEDHFGDGRDYGCRIEYLREEEPRGSGGALSLLPERPETPLLVMNGDLVTSIDVQAFLDHHEEKDWIASVGVREYQHTVPFGCVEAVDGRVRHLEEKPTLVRRINAGIYAIEPSLLSHVPAHGVFTMPALLDGCLRRGEPVGAFAIQEDWIDVGGADQLRRAREGSTA
jgi:NDP-sugar pyrophosphorylase family protein